MIDANYSEQTWYEATADRGAPRPSVSGRIEAQVCVVGGGLAGLTTALELARRGVSVALLEAKRIAWGASGRNGGFVSNGFAEGMDNVAARVGLDAAKALYQLTRHGTEYVRREIAEGDPTIKMGEGWQGCIRYSNADEKKAAIAEMARDYGQEMQFLDVAETRARVNTKRYFQSSYDPSAFHMHPLALCADDRGEGREGRCPAVRDFAGAFGRKAGQRLERCARSGARCGRRTWCIAFLRSTARSIPPRAAPSCRSRPMWR